MPRGKVHNEFTSIAGALLAALVKRSAWVRCTCHFVADQTTTSTNSEQSATSSKTGSTAAVPGDKLLAATSIENTPTSDAQPDLAATPSADVLNGMYLSLGPFMNSLLISTENAPSPALPLLLVSRLCFSI